jgi:hypothetical protein
MGGWSAAGWSIVALGVWACGGEEFTSAEADAEATGTSSGSAGSTSMSSMVGSQSVSVGPITGPGSSTGGAEGGGAGGAGGSAPIGNDASLLDVRDALSADVRADAVRDALGNQCMVPSDCPGVITECFMKTCTAGLCAIAPQPKGTLCNMLMDQCDGMGTCVDCVDNGGCGECCVCSANHCIMAAR